MEDRRMFERIKAEFPLRFLDPLSGKEGLAQVRDISANGLCFATNESLDLKTPLEMWLDIPDYHDSVYASGEIVWSKSMPDNSQKHIGIQLESVKIMDLARVLWMKKNQLQNN